ncbi:MAG: hypothetical protein K2P40_10885, partial [Lachnospiraceae bacterium]|nr:hypothetical protein [Lachnospiraceae bacterium]
MIEMHQANREAVFAWLDACNRMPTAELLPKAKAFIIFGIDFHKIKCDTKNIVFDSKITYSRI